MNNIGTRNSPEQVIRIRERPETNKFSAIFDLLVLVIIECLLLKYICFK